MAGELHTEGKRKPDRETDVYAFGGLILTVMSGKPPFYGLRDSAIILRIILNRTPKPEEHPDLPPDDDLWNLMRHCWDTDPTARPTMREVLWELRGHISLEQSSQGLTPRLLPTAEAGGRECSDMNLDVHRSLAVFAKRGAEAVASVVRKNREAPVYCS
ncbi:hypothetical protein FRC00_008302 [Tulasnella sp. 408]|nr:hypothetical protein FRC00_008302 [Tulasnella sp. 408]